MAGSHTFNHRTSAAAAKGRGRGMALGMAIAAGALLAIAPVAMTVIAPDSAEASVQVNHSSQSETSLVAFSGRNVELDGAIMQFSQKGDVVNLSLMASDDGQRVFVQDASGELFEIPVSPGQTNVTAELPANFAASTTLIFRVD